MKRLTRLFKKALVLLHHELTLQLLVELERNRYDNEHTCCRERIDERRVVEYRRKHDGRNKRYERQEYRAEKRKPFGYSRKVLGSRLAGAYAVYKAAVLLNVTRDILGIELDLCIEIREEQYQ